MALIKFAILTISDTCANGKKVDESGPQLETLVNNLSIGRKGEIICTAIVKDDEDLIMEYLISWSDIKKVDVILTTGGTGFAERDVTPEATKKVINKEVPGIPLAMLMASLKVTPMAMLSRATTGIRNKTLIVNLPGSCKAVTECFAAVAPVISHAVDLIADDKMKIKDAHHNISQCNITPLLHDSSCVKQINFVNVAERLRESPFPMISMEKAMELIYKSVEKREIEIVKAEYAYGKILAEDIYSNCHLPPFRASIKDGYAVLASDGKGKRTVLGGITAGDMSTVVSLKPGTCVRVNTGAPIPDEATAVVQVEDTRLILKSSDGTEEKEIEIMTEPKEEQDIRPIGCDIKKGSLILNSGTSIGSAEMGLLAACGCKEVKVNKLPAVGILSTGNELQNAGKPLKPGHVYDSNKITLMCILRENGFLPFDFGIVIDDEAVMECRIKEAVRKVDVLVTTGSVSMGDRDMLKPILEKYFKATTHFGRVNMKPGKPTTFATCYFKSMVGVKKKYFLCLPGNPVSATVTAHLFLLPLLNKMCGNVTDPVIVRAKLTSSYNLDPRPEYARAILKWNDTEELPIAYSTGNQISSKLLSCKGANALLMLPARKAEKEVLNEGDIVPAMLIGFK